MSHTPNHIPLRTRLFRAGGATFLLAYGIISLRMDDFIIPGKREAMHVHGLPGWVLFAALIAGIVAMISAIVDHYDRRDNESLYRRIEEWGTKAGHALFALAMGLYIAGVRYPAENQFTKLSVGAALLLTPLLLAMALRQRGPSLPGTTTAPDALPGASANYPPVRWKAIAGVVLVPVGGLLSVLALPQAIRLPLSIYGAFFSAAFGATILGVYLLHTRNAPAQGDVPATPSNARPVVTSTPVRRKPLLWLVAAAIVGTALILAVRRPADTWRPADEQALASAPVFSHAANDFRAGTSFAEMRTSLGKEGFQPRCYENLRSEDKLNADDVAICWIYARKTFGIESRMLAFFFGPSGLQTVRVEFPSDEWPQVQRWFDALSPASPVRNNGVDAWGDPVFVREIPGATVITGEPGRGAPVIVVWRAGHVARTVPSRP